MSVPEGRISLHPKARAEPSALTHAGHSTHVVKVQRALCFQSVLLVLFVRPIILLFTLSTLFSEPSVGKVRSWAGWKETEELQTHLFSPGWRGSHYTGLSWLTEAAIAAATT